MYDVPKPQYVNTLKSEQNGPHFLDDIFAINALSWMKILVILLKFSLDLFLRFW